MKIKFTTLFFLAVCKICFAQNPINHAGIEQGINPAEPFYENVPVQNTSSFTSIKNNSAGLSCGTTTFWARVGNNAEEFSISGNIITPTGQVITGTTSYSLAFCNNLNGNPFSPTLYTELPTAGGLLYYDGTGWLTVSPVIPTGITAFYNMGGFGNLMYLHGKDAATNDYLLKYDGTTMASVYAFFPKKVSAADIAVDASGNAWVVSGNGFGQADSIVAISPSGQLLHQYAFTFNTGNAYGMFLVNDTLYLGLGPGNPTAPNTLLPVTFSGTTAIIGTPVPTPVTLNGDLASCNPGSPLGLFDAGSSTQPGIYLFPNPSKGRVTITTSSAITLIQISNTLGQLVYQATPFDTGAEIKMKSKGIYFVTITCGNELVTKKVVVD